MYESISKNNELENEMTLDMSYFFYSDALCHPLNSFSWVVTPFLKIPNTSFLTSIVTNLPCLQMGQ